MDEEEIEMIAQKTRELLAKPRRMEFEDQ